MTILVAVLAGACSPTEPAIGDGVMLVQTHATEYEAGDSVYLSLSNVGRIGVDYMPCPLLLDRREGTRWIEHGPPILDVCDLIVLRIEAGAVRSQPVRLPDELSPGTYRLRFESLAPEDRISEVKLPLEFRVSNPFAAR